MKDLSEYFNNLKNVLSENQIRYMYMSLIRDLYEYDLQRISSYLKLKSINKIQYCATYLDACTETINFSRNECDKIPYRNEEIFPTQDDFFQSFMKEFSLEHPNFQGTYSCTRKEGVYQNGWHGFYQHKITFDKWRDEIKTLPILNKYVRLILAKSPLKVEVYSDEWDYIVKFLAGDISTEKFVGYINAVKSQSELLKEFQ